MDWGDLFIVLVVSHLAGDFLLQTEWQAMNKQGGLGPDPVKRRALAMHVVTYAIAFVPVLVWVATQEGVAGDLVVVLLGIVPHYVQDDGRLLRAYVLRVKKVQPPSGSFLWVAVDQSFHIVALLAAALVVGLAL